MFLSIAWTHFMTTLLVLIIGGIGCLFGQETDRRPFAIEFPELATGHLRGVTSQISSSDVSVIKFWVYEPQASDIDWGRITVHINRQSANRICEQKASSKGKFFQCDLNRFAGFRLASRENLLEIEAAGRDGKRFEAQFRVVIDGASASGQKQLRSSGRKFAVVLGISKYRYNDVGLGNLAYADADAIALAAWLRTNGGFAPNDVLLITNEGATLNFVRDALQRFLSKATATDLVLFYLASHGTPDPFNPSELYYIMHDSKVADLKNTGFRMSELKTIIDRYLSSQRAIFLLDTCHSAGVSDKKVVAFTPKSAQKTVGLGGKRELVQVEVQNDVNESAGRLFGIPGRSILTSSEVGESSLESKDWGGGHGVFTWAVLEGLNGKADVDRDGAITTDELFSFVKLYVKQASAGRQNPRLFSNLGGV
jgi:hypothetical protein